MSIGRTIPISQNDVERLMWVSMCVRCVQDQGEGMMDTEMRGRVENALPEKTG